MKKTIKKIVRKVVSPDMYTKLFLAYKKIWKHKDLPEFNTKFAHFNKAGFYDFTLDDTQFKIALHPDNGCVDLEIFASGNYEPDILHLIKQQLHPEAVFLDIGANIGQHSLFASRHCKHVYSFEPMKKIYDQFYSSIFVNDILNISLYNYGLGNKAEVLPIYGNDNIGASSVFTNENRKKIQDIKVLRLDDVYKQIGINNCDLVKIDVEGYELEVLKGGENFFKKYKPKIILEYTPFFYDKKDPNISKEIIQLLFSLGYALYDIDNNQVIDKNNIEDFHARVTFQTNIFCS